MADWASSGGIKLERAHEHIADLERRRERFFEPAPYKLVTENNPQGGTSAKWRRLPHARDIPPIWGAVAGDAIHNLRSALDILWRQATNPQPGKADPRRRGAYFPFPNTAHELKTRYEGAKEPALKSALNLANGFEPYESGNKDLWLLNQASTVDKHEVPAIVTCAFVTGTLSLAESEPYGLGLDLHMRATRPILVKDGEVFVTDLFGRHKAHDDDKLTFDIAFGECGPLKGKAVLPTLREFAGIVESIIETFLRAGLIR